MTESAAKSAGDPEEARADAELGDLLEFEHKIFTTGESAHFRLADNGTEPVLMLNLGDHDVALPFPGIKCEFDIADKSHDGRMLDVVSKGLKYVNYLCPGDPIPKELLTGEASWQISARHRDIAFQRLTLQLAGWLAGDETQVTDPEELLQLAEDPATKKRINDALGEAAEHIGFDRDDKERVLSLIESLAEDLAGIEAMRDQFKNVLMMREKIQGLRKLYGSELSVLEIADPVARLIEIAAKDYGEQFEQLDAQTCEIISVLKNIEAQRKYIREMRDELHCRLMAWEEVFTSWEEVTLRRHLKNEQLLRETYKFLAPRFMPVVNWTLHSKALDQKRIGGEMVW